MEFNEKLQLLRKQRGLTQEELASALFVSRTAVSKWESARGYPSIDSLKDIAKFFSVTVDELISGGEALSLACECEKAKDAKRRDLVFGLLDIAAALLFVLPLFAVRDIEVISNSSLLSFFCTNLYLKTSYFTVTVLTVLFGIVTLALQNCEKSAWIRSKSIISISLSFVALLLFIVSSQPYAALFVLTLLSVKAILFIKRP